MKFRISERDGLFGRANFRNEKHGKENVPAADIAISFKGSKRDIDVLFPFLEGKASDVMYTEKGRLQAPFMLVQNARTPENVTFTVWDQATKKKDPLEFTGCKVKIRKTELHDKYNVEVEVLVQLHDDPDEHAARLRWLMDNTRRFSLESQQDDFWNDDPEEKKAKDKQPTLPGVEDAGGEGEEGEEDEG